MPGLTWVCTCGAENPASAPTCTSCGKVPGLAPPTAEETAARPAPVPPRAEKRRRPLPFSASGRRATPAVGQGSVSVDDGPGLVEARTDTRYGFPDGRRPGSDQSTPAWVDPEPAAWLAPAPSEPADRPSASAPAASGSPGPAVAPPPVADAAPARRSFFDPEPESTPAVIAATAKRRRATTPTLVVTVIGVLIALAVVAYVIANTGNSKPPDQGPQASMGAAAATIRSRPQAQALVAAMPPVQDANNAA